MLEFLKKHKRHLATISWVITIASVTFSVYSYFRPFNQNPHLTIYVKNSTDVFQLNTDNKDIKVLFRDKDILKDQLNLRVTNLKIVNDGNSDISSNDFDLNREPLGLGISKGEIISTEIYDASSKSLLDVLDKNKSDSLKLFFKSFIFLKDQYFHIRITYLYTNKQMPLIVRYGQMANCGIDFSTREEGSTFSRILMLVLALALGVFILYIILQIIWLTYTSSRNALRRRKFRNIYVQKYEGQRIYKEAFRELFEYYGRKKLSEFIYDFTSDKGKRFLKETKYEEAKGILRRYKCITKENEEDVLQEDFIEEAKSIKKVISN